MIRRSVDWVWPENFRVGAADRGLAYGDGLFETLRLIDSQPILLELHFKRLLAGARHLGLACDRQLLAQWWQELVRRLRAQGLDNGVVKLILTRGSGGRGYRPPASPRLTVITSFHPVPPLPGDGGVATVLCRTRMHATMGGFKTLNRLEQVQASAELPADAYEGLMLDHAGRLTEGTRTNLFLIDEQGLVSPPTASLAVNGVMRTALMQLLPSAGIPVREQCLQWDRVRRGRGLILVNSVSGIVEVRRIGCLELPSDSRVATIRRLSKQAFGL
ncbi:aminotransferase class IV [Mangrovitalea sediminis]|uniref:aminotransferase class IV n=1 Tax=Mangrovitalea sediminis TaxID=1982043 RepID=UPI000BE4C167|nr:aminotransferase class IV [Mangrovitalea sediminis]